MEPCTRTRWMAYSLLCLSGVAMAAGCSEDDKTVTEPAGSFTLALSSSALTVAPGGSVTTTVTLTPTNFTGAVALSVEGAPVGLTAAFNPTPATSSSVLTITTVAALTPGSYTLTVRGTASGMADRTAPLAVNVVAQAGLPNVIVSFANCPAAFRPVWLAYKDGTDAWAVVTGVADVYTFGVAQAKGGIAYATVSDSSIVSVIYLTQAEMIAGQLNYYSRLEGCPIFGSKVVNGSVTNLNVTDIANVSLGTSQAQVVGNNAFSLTTVRDGLMDLVGYKYLSTGPGGAADRMFLRRAINPANGGSVGALDFLGAESFNPAVATMTIATLAGGETALHSMYYYTAGLPDECQISTLYSNATVVGSTFTAYGAPAANQLLTDWHGVGVFTALNNNSFRTLHEYFHTMANRTLTLGAAMPAPTVTSLAAPYKALRATVTMPADYGSRVTLRYRDPAGVHQSVVIMASNGWVGGTAVDLSLPDFSALAGWSNAWAPPSASSVNWQLIGANATTPPHCAANARFISAIRTGSL